MKRRDFLEISGKILGGGSAAWVGFPLAPDPGARTPGGAAGVGRSDFFPSRARRNRLTDSGEAFQYWTWVHGGGDRTPSEWRTQFHRLAAAGFKGVLVGGGDTEVLADAAHANGLEFHRWIWTLNRNGDVWVRENHPEWFTVSREGKSTLTHPPYVGYYRWLCPTRPQVRQYLRDSILHIAREPEVDGIHLDYIRHSDVILPPGLWSKYDLIQDQEYPEFDYCYCEACREEYSSQTGVDPLELPDPPKDEEWRRFRWNSVTELVRALAEAVHSVSGEKNPGLLGDRPSEAISVSRLRPKEPGKPISAAVFPTPSIARRLVRQAWDEWPLDAFFPMLYHEFYETGLPWIGSGVEEGLRTLGSREPGMNAPPNPKLIAGLYLPTLNRDENRQQAVDVAREAGADGVSFFEMNGLGI